MSFYWYVLLTMLFFGTAPIIEKLALRDIQPLTGTMIRSIVVTIVMTAAVAFSGQIGELKSVGWKTIAFLGIGGIFAGGLAQWSYYSALKLERAALVVPLVAAYPVVAMILGIAILGESLTLLRTLGVLLVVGGAVLVKVG